MAYLQLTMGTAVPTLVTHGNPLRLGASVGLPDQGFTDGQLEQLVLFYRATVTAGQTASMSFLRLWIYTEVGTDDWYPVGPVVTGGSDADRGKLNNATALGEILTDKINFTQVVNLPGGASRVYLQQGTSGGSGYADTAYLVRGWTL